MRRCNTDAVVLRGNPSERNLRLLVVEYCLKVEQIQAAHG